MKFIIEKKDKNSKARAGKIITDHGEIYTPVFMPVGTLGTVKGVLQEILIDKINVNIILANTYHLYLRPGTEIIEKAQGLHKFIKWNKPILTDSGGYQVFSLSKQIKILDDGIKFSSHIDGSYHFFTPEKVIDIQRILGSDIIMPLDICSPYPCSFDIAKYHLNLTLEWYKKSLNYFKNTKPLYDHNQVLFPIVQGSTYSELRLYCLKKVLEFDPDGIAIGGLAVGEPDNIMYEMIDVITNNINKNIPVYLMGVGTPENILKCISLGIDMFDCVLPTRNGRNGMLFTTQGIINIRNKKWENDFSPIDPENISFVDGYSKAYLRHLFQTDEMLGPIIASIHNIGFYMWLVKKAREKILENNFNIWASNIIPLIMQRL